MKKFLALTLALLMALTILPVSALAEFDTSVSGDYFIKISEDTYNLAPGATETEMVLNNAAGDDRKVVHFFEVDTKNENVEVLPGYYGIDKLDPDNLALDGVVDKTQYWKAEQLTKTVAYYEGLGYNVVGAMNTALAYDSDAPYGYMVWDGVVLGTPEVHKGAQTYLAIDNDGNCELRSMSTPLTGNEKTAISANFGWIVKDGELVTKTVERTSSDASRSMIGIKADGTLVFCLVDGRNAPLSTGLSNYELGEMMLSLGCVNAVNCDGGGSSTFVSKREGETANTMRSVPSDGSERATINSVILVSKAKATGEFDHAVLDAEYNYYAPGTSATVEVTGVDAAGTPAKLPEEGISWALSDASFGTVENGVFTSNGTKGDVTVQMLYNGQVVGSKTIHVVDPDSFALALDETVLPYGKEMTIDFACTYGADDWAVCVDGAYTLALSNASAATLNGNVLKATTDESIAGVDVVATYTPNPSVTDTLAITYGKGSEIVFDFEDGDVSDFMGVDEMMDWAEETGAAAPIQSDSNFSDETDAETFLASPNRGQVKNGNHALGVTLDYTAGAYASWTYNMFFYTKESIVLRDTANGMNATTFGMWVYIPEGAAGLAMQLLGYTNAAHTAKTGIHFYFTTASGAKKNLNSCSEADIPESRWVYATADLTSLSYLETFDPYGTNGREPSFIRFYVKPTTAFKATFYFDDFTLDYSSAVDDRVLPTISDITYTTADEGVSFADGATINGTNVAFGATVADNVKLDTASGKIVVDGKEIASAKITGKYLVCDTTSLLPGAHTVSFEVKDSLGNLARVTRTFTVVGDAPITLGGHNDSGEMPEIDSVYYVDLNVADITAVNKVTTTLKLQTANTWEPQGMVVADGFKATYDLNQTEGFLTLTIERNGEDIDANATALVSVPVRLWSWKGVNHVTDEPITAATQYATGNNPVVKVECEVVAGAIEMANESGTFSGNSISVETMINDIVYPWHTHDAELVTLEDKAATCMVDGYTGRTYCATCASVMDWGTVVEAIGHNFENGNCTECGKEYNYTGLLEKDGNWYYYVNGKEVTGWQMIGSDWYYFDTTTKIGANGDLKIGVVTYNFVDGKLTSGVWAETLLGTRYYYGPGFYNDRGSWRNIDGKDYYFEKGVRLEGGWQLLFENQINKNWYYFNEDGSCDKSVKPADGFYTDRNGYAYAKDGQGLAGLQTIDGKSYYFDSKGYAKTNGTYASRLFLDDYAAYTGLYEKDGVLYYYQDGRTATCGLFNIDGDYYYSYWGGIIKTSGQYYVSRTYCDLPVGTYEFGADGKMLNGIVEKDGVQYLYANGKLASYGLYKIGDDYYFASNSGDFKTNGRFYVSKSFCDLPAGNYTFGADGKMLDGVVEQDGELYLYKNGTTATHGLVEMDGKYYFPTWGGVLKTDGRYYVSRTYCDLPVGNYTFGADGAMLDGIVEVDGELYLYKNGTTSTCGLFEVDGKYYYAYWGGVLKTDGRYYVSRTYCDLPVGNYTFGADGAMLNGVVEVDGELYLYKNGTTVTAGMYEVDGDYYYVNWGGALRTDGRFYASRTYCDLPVGNYTFGADGKMLNGFVTIDGVKYYYKNGSCPAPGVICVDGDYYYVNWNGVVVVNQKFYVSNGNGYTIPMTYTFDADGKIIG